MYSRGATPTIVYDSDPDRMSRPTTSGSRWKRRSQTAWLMTAAGSRSFANQRPGDGLSPEHVRVVGGRDFRDHEAALAVRVEVGLHRKRHGEPRQHTGARLDLSIVGIRPGRVDAAADEDQPVGPRDRHRPQHDRIDHAEDGRVDADAEPEAEHREHRKTRSAPELPERMAHVAAEILDEADAACVAVLLLDLIEPAELDARPAHGLVPRHPVPHVRFDQALEMEPELVVQLLFDGVALEEGPETEEPVGQHGGLYTLSSTWATASLNLRHAEISTSSRARPRLVSS